MTKLDKMGIKQLHLVCTFIIWCLFSSLIKCSETSLGVVVILSLVMIGQLQLTFSELKQVIHDQTRQNGYQIVPFSVYIHNLMFVFILEWLFWKESRYGCDFITCTYQLIILPFSGLKQLILDQTEQNGYQTVPFSVFIHNLMFVFLFDHVLWN